MTSLNCWILLWTAAVVSREVIRRCFAGQGSLRGNANHVLMGDNRHGISPWMVCRKVANSTDISCIGSNPQQTMNVHWGVNSLIGRLYLWTRQVLLSLPTSGHTTLHCASKAIISMHTRLLIELPLTSQGKLGPRYSHTQFSTYSLTSTRISSLLHRRSSD